GRSLRDAADPAVRSGRRAHVRPLAKGAGTVTALSVAGVTKAFGHVPVLREVSLVVPAGTRTAIVGSSGSGKSTLLRLIAGFERADAGEIRLGDWALTAPGSFVPAHRRGIGYVA